MAAEFRSHPISNFHHGLLIAPGPSAQVDSRDVVSPQNLNQRAPALALRTAGSVPRSRLVPCRICSIDGSERPILPIASLLTLIHDADD